MGKYTINAKRDVNFVDQGHFYQHNSNGNTHLNQQNLDDFAAINKKINALITLMTHKATQNNFAKEQALIALSNQQQYIDKLINNTATVEEKSHIKQFFLSLQHGSSKIFTLASDIKEYEEVLEWVAQKANDLIPYL